MVSLKGINIPEKELRSAYYAIKHEDTTYHVFNAETMLYEEIFQRAAFLLQGKHKPIYKRNKSTFGDVVIVANCNNIRMKGDELRYKYFKYHTGSPGGLKKRYFKDYINKNATFIFYCGIYKKLPTNKLRYRFMENLYCYEGGEVKFADFLPNVR